MIVRTHKGSSLQGKLYSVGLVWQTRAELCSFLDWWAKYPLDDQTGMEFDFVFTNAYLYFQSNDTRNAFIDAWNARLGNGELSSVQTAP